MPNLVKRKEICDKYKINKNTLKRWGIAEYKPGRIVYIDENEVIAKIQSSKIN